MNLLRTEWIVAALWLLAGSIALALTNDYHALVLGTIACTAMVGIGLNVLMGLAGQTSLGHAAFYSLGAYTATILSMRLGLPYILAVVVAALVAGLAGALLSLPALRVKGPYLAMITIAFGYFVEQGIADWKDITGGWNGIMNIPSPSLWGLQLTAVHIAWIVFLLTALLIPAYSAFSRSRWGIVMRATRDSEVAAGSLGANLMAVRVVAFSLSAALTGVAGAFFATLNGFISPESFPFFQSITFLLVVMIGGVARASGPLVGALIVILLPEALSALAEYRLIFFGGLLLIVLLIAPNGMVGAASLLAQKFIKDKVALQRSSVATDISVWLSRKAPVSLSIRGMGIAFGGNKALSGVTIDVQGGRITSLIGPNGAGKTTLLNLVTGFYAPGEGEFQLGDKRLTGLAGYQIGRSQITRTFQTSQLFDGMTVAENVYFGLLQGRMLNTNIGEHAWQTCEQLLSFVGFAGSVNTQAGELAHVDRRLVEIARALAARPAMLLLDEPAAGLSGEEKKQLAEILKKISAMHIGVFIIEHDMALVMSISDQIHVLDGGKLIATGSPMEIRGNARVKAAYLGEGGAKFLTHVAQLGSGTRLQQHDVLVLTNISANYGAADVLLGVNLTVRQGETAAVLGANGAGKSTLMRVIAGLHKGFKGSVAFAGRDISNVPAHKIAAMGLVMVPEGRQVFTELSVQDNIEIGAHSRGGLSRAQLDRLYEMFPKLRVIRARRAGLLSGGEQQMLALARGLAASPTMMLLDEPSLGLAPAIVEDLFIKLADLRKSGMTLLLVDQMADMAMALSDRASLLSAGETIFSGTPQALKESGCLDQAYLG